MRPGLLLLLLVLPGCGSAAPTSASPVGEGAGGAEVMVAAAASLRGVLPALLEAHSKSSPAVRVRATYAASGSLRRQVEAGAPVDLVLFASAREVELLVQSGQVTADGGVVLGTNELVLAVPVSAAGSGLRFRSLAELPEGSLVAVGDPSTVPAGRYGKEALEQLGAWRSLEGRRILAGDVTAALTYARRGEVAAAIVYSTDVVGIDDVVIADRANWDGAPSPQVVGALTVEGRARVEARDFMAFLQSDAAQQLLRRAGFGAD